MSDLLRGGRLSTSRKDVTAFTSSIKGDIVLFPSVVKINQAHIVMLMEKEIIPKDEGKLLLKALKGIRKVVVRPSMEDVHMYVEEEVTKATGEQVGGNLHIAKSRNDQVATAIRMKLRQDLVQLAAKVTTLQEAIVRKARQHVNTIFPGYTHLQPAQPITLAHYLVSCFDVAERNLQRIREAYPRVNQCPMGACALATTSFPISRERVAELLGFDGLVENSVDAVGSRDFVLEVLAVLTVLAVDVSRMIEDLIVWSSLDFGLVELPDEFAFTSSIMPQKKNPEVLEVIRARTSHILGNFVSCASSLKALPSSYNLDLQEITPKLWESLREIEESLKILSKLLPRLKTKENIFDKPNLAFTTSTELANMLTRKYDVPFRTAHKTIGALTKHLMENNQTNRDISEKLLEKFLKENIDPPPEITLKDIREAIDPRKFVEKHNVMGGPSPKEVRRMLQVRRILILSSREWVDKTRAKLSNAEGELENSLKAYELP